MTLSEHSKNLLGVSLLEGKHLSSENPVCIARLMDYYQSDRPPVDDSGLSGGVSFRLGGVIASSFTAAPVSGFNPDSSSQSTGGGGGQDRVYTLDICVNGIPIKINVYVTGNPY
jgi:hypothetical protein